MRALSILKKRNISFTIYDDILPPYASVFYTDYEYYADIARKHKHIHLIYDPTPTCLGLEKAILASFGKEKYNEVTVGIDPGPIPYYVVLGDGNILDYGCLNGDIDETIKNIVQCYPTSTTRIRIGSCYNGPELAIQIKESIPQAIVEIVDENETSPRRHRYHHLMRKDILDKIKPYRNKDAYAAIRIAFRKGIEIEV